MDFVICQYSFETTDFDKPVGCFRVLVKLDKLKHLCYSGIEHGDDRFRQGRVGTDCKPRSLTSLNRAKTLSAKKVPAFNVTSLNRAKTLSAKKVPAFNAPSYNALPLAA
jgi:hypothetical protein